MVRAITNTAKTDRAERGLRQRLYPAFVSVAAVIAGAVCLLSASDRITVQAPAPSQVYFGGEASGRVARVALAENDIPTAFTAARRFVRTDPVDPSAAATLASVHLIRGDAAAAHSAFLVASNLGWRVTSTQLYWLIYSLQINDLDGAITRFRALMRKNTPRNAMQPAIELLENSPDGRQAIAGLLAQNPPWIRNYIVNSSYLDGQPFENRIAVYDLAVANGAQFNCDDARSARNSLASRGRRADGERLQSHICTQSATGSLYNGDFDAEERGGNNWHFMMRSGISISTRRAPSLMQGNALYVSSTLPRDIDVANQKIALKPGSYSLNWRAITGDGTRDAAISISVKCGDNGRELTNGPEAAGNTPQSFSDTFIVPETKCARQTIGISRNASGLSSTVSWIDDVMIEAKQ